MERVIKSRAIPIATRAHRLKVKGPCFSCMRLMHGQRDLGPFHLPSPVQSRKDPQGILATLDILEVTG